MSPNVGLTEEVRMRSEAVREVVREVVASAIGQRILASESPSTAFRRFCDCEEFPATQQLVKEEDKDTGAEYRAARGRMRTARGGTEPR
jgi:hypothetical protein